MSVAELVMTDDLQVPRSVTDEGVIEPRQILTHETPGQVVGCLNDIALFTDLVFVAYAPIAFLNCPFVKASGVAGIDAFTGCGVERKLTTRIVQY